MSDTPLLDGVVLLRRDGSNSYTVELDGGEYALTVWGREGDRGALSVAIAPENGGGAPSPVFVENAGVGCFSDGGERDQLARRAGRLLARVSDMTEEQAADAVGGGLDDVGALLADDRLHVVDETNERLLRQTEQVHVDSIAGGGVASWNVAFRGEKFDKSSLTYTRPHLSLDADEWASPTAPDDPEWGEPRAKRRFGETRFAGVFDGDRADERWRTCRAVWTRAAETGDDAPTVAEDMTADALEARGTVPFADVDLEEFVRLVEDRDMLLGGPNRPGVNSAIGSVPTRVSRNAVQELGLADELDDVDPQ